MKAPKPADKWFYNGGYAGERGRKAIVLGVGNGIMYVGGPIAPRVWLEWQDGDRGKACWPRKEFIRHFRPHNPVPQEVCEPRANRGTSRFGSDEHIESVLDKWKIAYADKCSECHQLRSKNAAAQKALSQ